MPSFPWMTVIDCLAVLLFLRLLITFRDHSRRKGLPYPPGPPALPVIGNLLDVPKQSAWVGYEAMSKKYGDVICLHVFGQVIVVLSSVSAIKDLLEKRGERYAGRSVWPIQEILGLDWLLPTSSVNEHWREGRKLLDRSLGPGSTASYRRTMEDTARLFLGRLLDTPEDFLSHIGFLQGKLITSLTYGYELKDKNDEFIVAAVQASNLVLPLIVPGAVLVNHLPFLRHIPHWIPWFNYESLAQRGRDISSRIKEVPFKFVKTAMQNGTAVRSLATEYLEETENLAAPQRRKREELIKETLAALYVAGSDSTVSALSSLFLALVLYPEVQKRAQAELDSVVTRDRLPTFDDRSRLPYIGALCRELLRWQMVTPLGVPHASTEDDVYKGLFIPKGAIMVANAWAIFHNPDLYPDPETFKPERFLNDDGTLRDDPVITLAFGVGKRICPGRHFVDSTLFIFASAILSVFDVVKAKDEKGREIPVKVATSFANSIATRPEKFECAIIPRDKSAKYLILACLD